MIRRRSGSRKRRQLEFDAIAYHVRRDKAGFIARLERNTVVVNDGERDHCLWTGYKRAEGYGRWSCRYKGKHISIDTQRLFLILRLARAIRVGYDAGHTCEHRDCVMHVEEQKMGENCSTDPDGSNAGIATRQREANGRWSEIPF